MYIYIYIHHAMCIYRCIRCGNLKKKNSLRPLPQLLPDNIFPRPRVSWGVQQQSLVQWVGFFLTQKKKMQ